MKEKHALLLVGVTSALTLATIGFLGYRIYSASQMPTQDELAEQARVSRQIGSDAAQSGIDALLALTLPDLAGQPQPLKQWQGRVRVINYWASWCPPCVEEMPMFSRLAERYAAHGVQFVGVGLDEADKMREFARKSPVAYPLLVGGADPADKPGLVVKGLPYTVVLDRDGKVVFSLYGGVKPGELEPVLDRLAGQK